MSVRSRILATLCALIVGIGGAFAAGAPAYAYGGDCPSAAVCFWDGTYWDGSKYHWTSPPNGCTNSAGAWNDRADSARINYGSSSAYMILYKDAGCSGSVIATITKQGSSPNRYANCNNYLNDRWNDSLSECNDSAVSSFWYVY